MPRDHWRKAADRATARYAAREYATDGQFQSFDSLYDEAIPKSAQPKEKGSKHRAVAPTPIRAGTKFRLPWLTRSERVLMNWLSDVSTAICSANGKAYFFKWLPTAKDIAAVPGLLTVLEQSQGVNHLLLGRALQLIGPEALHQLGLKLDSKDRIVKLNAATTFRYVGEVGPFARARLQRVAEHSDPEVKRAALQTLSIIMQASTEMRSRRAARSSKKSATSRRRKRSRRAGSSIPKKSRAQ